MSEIIIRHGHTTLLAKKCNCTIQTVRLALKGITSSELSDRIRKEALELGGVEIQIKKLRPVKSNQKQKS